MLGNSKGLRQGLLVCCSFDLDVLGGDVTLLPGLEAWLNSFLASSVLRSGLFTVSIMLLYRSSLTNCVKVAGELPWPSSARPDRAP